MIPTRHCALRAALLLVPAVVVGLLGVHHLGVVSAQTARPTEQAVRALRHLRLAVAVVGLHVAVCTVGMSAVLDRRGYGMPGLWLLALLAEAGLAALVVGLGRTQREARTEVVHDRRTGRVPRPR